MYSIELPTKEELTNERNALRQHFLKAPEYIREALAKDVLYIHATLSNGLNKTRDIAGKLEQLDANAIRNEDLSTQEKLENFRDIIRAKINQYQKLIQLIDELLTTSSRINDVIKSLEYSGVQQQIPQNPWLEKLKQRLSQFKTAIYTDLPELKESVEKEVLPYQKLEQDLLNKIILGDVQYTQSLSRFRELHQKEKAFSPNFRRFLRGVASVIAVVTIWFSGDSGNGTIADIDTPMPAVSAAASPSAAPSHYASPSASERKVDFSRMPTSQFVEISTLPTGQTMVQNKEGKTLTLSNIGGNKWIGSDGNQYISFKYPFGTKNFFTLVKIKTPGAEPTESPSPSPSEGPSATEIPSAPEFDFTKEKSGTLKFYIEDSDGITAIGIDGNGAILKPAKEIGLGVFRSAGGRLYNKRISQRSVIFVPR